MEQKLNTSGRIYDLDVLRTLACCAVVMIHASAQYASNDVGTLNFFIGNFWDSLSRFAVPVFVRSFFSGSFHLWFCYMIVGLYLILPLLRLWVKRENVPTGAVAQHHKRRSGDPISFCHDLRRELGAVRASGKDAMDKTVR